MHVKGSNFLNEISVHLDEISYREISYSILLLRRVYAVLKLTGHFMASFHACAFALHMALSQAFLPIAVLFGQIVFVPLF
jgi:hypothetical protein